MRVTRNLDDLMERARRVCRRLFHRVYHPYALRQIAKPVTALRGLTLLTDPEVFHPVHFLSTPVFVDYVATFDLAGKRLLDMGTGSGAVGIFAARRGAQVTACDINPRAVVLARDNARRNGVDVEILESDLFSSLGGRTFDLICFNLPFYPGQPATPFEAAFFGGPAFETISAFAAGCRGVLAPGGTVAVIISEDSGHDRIVSLFKGAGFAPIDDRAARNFFERFHLLRFRRDPGGAPSTSVNG
jgi:release factor glutamine methyltransferase